MKLIGDSKFEPACGSYHKCTTCNKLVPKNRTGSHKCAEVNIRSIRISQKKHRQYTDSVIENMAGVANKYNI